MKNFCVAAVKVKNDLGRSKVIARSVPEKCPFSQAAGNTQDVLESSAASGAGAGAGAGAGYFLPKLDLAYLVQLPTVFLWAGFCVVPNVIKTGLKIIYKACSCSQRTTSGLTTS